MREEEEYQVDTSLNEPAFLRVRLYSRFRNAGRYQLFVAYLPVPQDDPMEAEEPQEEPIVGYYCTCKQGSRTLGCCAHVASVLWFLGFAKHQQHVKYPSTAQPNGIMDAGNRYVMTETVD